MRQFLIGFFLAWALLSAALLYIEERDTRRVSFLDIRVFILLTAPVTLPAMLCAIAYRHCREPYRTMQTKLREYAANRRMNGEPRIR